MWCRWNNFYFLAGWLLLSMRVLHTASGDPEAVSAVVMMTTEETVTGVSSKDDVVYQTVYACQDEILKISCLTGYSIKIVRANYGRFSIAICNDGGRSDFSVNCLSPGSLVTLQSRCDGHPSCQAFANSTDFPSSSGDPCPATGKYLEAQFYCARDLEREKITTSTLPDFRTVTVPVAKSSNSKRIPITPKPRLSVVSETATTTSEEIALKTVRKEVNKITSKFLSSSIASTNIMDTSDLPVTLVASQVTSTISSSTSSTTTTTPATTTSISSSTSSNLDGLGAKQVFVAPSLHLESNKAYPILPKEPVDEGRKSDLKCPPLMKGGLKWNWTLAGDTAVLECGSKMAGLAYWQCDLEGRWMTSTPDLSQCQSYWLQKLRGQLDKSADKQASIVHVAKDLAHFAASNGPLNPGDLLLLIDTVESMTARMEADLKTIPTIDQRRVVITQVVQDILKTISLAVNVERNGIAWERLGTAAKQRKCVTLMIDALENAGLLLPEVIHENHEVTVASPNILLSVKGVNFGHMSKLRLPSQAATASENWSNFTNMVEIPSLDLMEHMQQGGDAQILFLSFKSLHRLLPPPQNEPEKPYRVISKIVSVTMGEYSKGLGLHPTTELKLNQPITITFVHEDLDSLQLHSASPTCAFWNVESHRWDKVGCKLLASNATHSRCGCQKLATFALLATPANHNGHQLFADQGFYNDHNDILVGIMAAIILVLLLLVLAILACYCRKRKVLVCCPRPCFCCQPFKLMCNGLLRSIKTYFCCHLRNSRIRKQHELARNHHSFAPSSLFNERIYELHDNSGSVMTTPTFNTNQPPVLRGSDDIFVSRAHYGVNLGYVQSPLSCQPPTDQVWHQHMEQSLDHPVSHRRTLNSRSCTSPRRRQQPSMTSPQDVILPEFASSPSADYGHIYHEISDQAQQQPIHRPLQSHLLQSGSSCSTSSSGYGSSIRYDNVRGDARGPFVSYPILEDRGGERERPKRPTELALNNSPLI